MKRALITANVDNFHKNFNLPCINQLLKNGYNVDLASKGSESFQNIDNKFNVEFERTPLKFKNVQAYRYLKKIIKQNYYDIIYCNTPVTGALTRLAARKVRRKGTRVIYSAHGFNFYCGCGKKDYLLYSTIEKFLSRFTDCMVTMNNEDYQACSDRGFKCSEVINVDGVGIDTQKFSKLSINEKLLLREKYGFQHDDFILVYIAELTKRKNQSLLINIVDKLVEKHSNIHLLLVGSGILEEQYKSNVAELKLQNNVHFLGYRKDIPEILGISDILVSSSLSEGLPINVIEGMASGLPVVASNVRGNSDLVRDGENGYLFELSDTNKAVQKIDLLINDKDLYEKMSLSSLSLSKIYDISCVLPQYDAIFCITGG